MCSPASEVSIPVTFVFPSTETTRTFPLLPSVAFKSSSWSVTFTRANKSALVIVVSVGTVFSFWFSITGATTGASFVTGYCVLPKYVPFVAPPL